MNAVTAAPMVALVFFQARVALLLPYVPNAIRIGMESRPSWVPHWHPAFGPIGGARRKRR